MEVDEVAAAAAAATAVEDKSLLAVMANVESTGGTWVSTVCTNERSDSSGDSSSRTG